MNRQTRRLNRHCPVASILHPLAVYARCGTRVVNPSAHLVAALNVHVFNVEGVDVAWEVAQDREQDVDEKIRAAA